MIKNYFGLMMLLVLLGMGCATTHRTTKTETVVTYPNQEVMNEGEKTTTTTVTTTGEHRSPEVVQHSETTTTTDTNKEHPGVLSSTLHAIGYVIILPFIIVGGLFRIIFGG